MFHRRAQLFLVTACLGLVGFCLTGCNFNYMPVTVAQAQKEALNSLQPKVSAPTIHEQGVLTVGLKNASSKPPMVINNGTGDLSGIDIDLGAALADNLGLKVKFVPITDASAANSCDVVMDVKTGDAGNLTVIGRYAESAIAFFHKGEAAVVSKEELASKTVGLQTGSSSQSALERTDLVMTQKGFANLNEAFDALNSGSVDYVLCDAQAGAYIAHTYKGLAMCGTLDVPTSYGLGVASSNITLQQAVQTALDDLSNNGVLALIKTRWLGASADMSAESQIKGLTLKAASTESANESTSDTSGDTAGSNAADVN